MDWIKEHWLLLVLAGLLLIALVVLIILVKRQKRKNREEDKKEQELEKKKNNKKVIGPILKSKDAEKKNTKKIISKPMKPTQHTSTQPKVGAKNEDAKFQFGSINEVKTNEGEDEMKKEAKAQPKKVEPKKPEPKKAEPKKVEKPDNETYRVVYDKEQKNWIVRIDGGQRASKRCATKEEALKVAKDLAKKKDADLSVHKKNGKFQKV